MERVKTGISGLDELIEGGIPAGSSVLLSGGSGTGKTIFAMQYLYEGAEKLKEAGIFVTIESNVKNIVWNMQSFNWDIKKLQDKNLLKIYRLNVGTMKELPFDEYLERELKIISQMVKEMGAKRLVVDSTTALGIWLGEPARIRNSLFNFTNALKDLNCTTILTAETKGGKSDFSAFGVEEFVADGVIALYFTPPNRSVFVRKMRGTNHSKSVHPFDITEQGIKIRARDEIMWESVK